MEFLFPNSNSPDTGLPASPALTERDFLNLPDSDMVLLEPTNCDSSSPSVESSEDNSVGDQASCSAVAGSPATNAQNAPPKTRPTGKKVCFSAEKVSTVKVRSKTEKSTFSDTMMALADVKTKSKEAIVSAQLAHAERQAIRDHEYRMRELNIKERELVLREQERAEKRHADLVKHF